MSSQKLTYHFLSEEKGVFRFQLKNVDVSIANAIRRTIISDIPVVVLDVENITIETNTCPRCDNDKVRHFLKNVSVHPPSLSAKEMAKFAEDHVMILDMSNGWTGNEAKAMHVSSKHFLVKNKESDKILEESKRDKIFPPHPEFQNFLPMLTLHPCVREALTPQAIKLVCPFKVTTAREDSCYSAQSTCSYGFTLDEKRVAQMWEELKIETEKKAQEEGLNQSQIQNRVASREIDFHVLDAQRIYVSNSFDFIVKSSSAYGNVELVYTACEILRAEFMRLHSALQVGDDSICELKEGLEATPSYTTPNSFVLKLFQHDYGVGRILTHYLNASEGLVASFKQLHPQDLFYVLLLVFTEETSRETSLTRMLEAIDKAEKLFMNIARVFKK